MNERLVLFVHGLGGNAQRTWGDFTRLLLSDKDLGSLRVGHFTYPTFLLRWPFGKKYPGVQTLADALSTQIENRYAQFEDITLVCHSLGGLIGKYYLADCLDKQRTHRIQRALFYAVPNNGSSLASVANLISWRHPQLKQLCKESDVVRSIAQSWHRLNLESEIDIRYVVGAQDVVVDEHSSRQTWANELVDVLVDKGHIDAVKPKSADDMSYMILKNHLLKNKSTNPKSPKNIQMDGQKPNPKLQASIESPEVRIAVSAILRIERDARYLLVRNLHRPETFAPFGGVYKYFGKAKPSLDRLSFRSQVVDTDMRSDIRGYIATDALGDFKAWFDAEVERESAFDCLRRELREELFEVGLSSELVPSALRFQHVRTVREGPEYIPSLGCHQYRVFDVYEIVEDSEESRRLIQSLFQHATSSNDFLEVDAESAKKGRAPSGQVVAAHVAYLFGTKRYRDGDPLFSVK